MTQHPGRSRIPALPPAASRPAALVLALWAGLGLAGCADHGLQDLVPPTVVRDLQASSRDTTSIRLTWTAPGDPGARTGAARYELRYSSAPVVDSTWSSATPVPGVPAPAAPGQAESLVAGGLQPRILWHFALRSADEAGNWSGLSNDASALSVIPGDRTPPDAVTNLNWRERADSSITLVWTAPGDDHAEGEASVYDLRYSTFELSELTWPTATRASGLLAPRTAGRQDGFRVLGLIPGTPYSFALKTADEVPNWSALSNVLAVSTRDVNPPARVTDLTLETLSECSVRLTWAAPGDDGALGHADRYDILYSTPPDTGASWPDWPRWLDPPDPRPPGERESFVLSGLALGDEFHFALRAADEADNWSQPSNVVRLVTPPAPGGDGNWHNDIGAAGSDREVRALTEYRGDLIAAGRFTVMGADSVDHIARWDGVRWQPLGPGLHGIVNALLVWRGSLIAGGGFTASGENPMPCIASWDGTAWHSLRRGCDGEVLALAEYEGDLIAAGRFSAADGVSAARVARWDGTSWSPLSTGLSGPPSPPSAGTCAAAVGGILYVGGQFSLAGGDLAQNIARWDGAVWGALGAGIDHPVQVLTAYGGALIAGGEFGQVDGRPYRFLARYDGNSWNPVGWPPDRAVRALAVYNGRLLVGGDFSTAGGARALRVAAWDGNCWARLGSGIQGGYLEGIIYAIAPRSNGVAVGGLFLAAGGQASLNLAWWSD